jgi:hypothetical protein
LRAVARLTLKGADDDSLQRLSDVLSPDNEGLPRGLKLSVSQDARTLAYLVESDSPSTAVSTVLALLRDIVLFQEVWLLSRTRRGRERRHA